MIKLFEDYNTHKLDEFINYLCSFLRDNDIIKKGYKLDNSFLNSFFINEIYSDDTVFEFTVKDDDYIYIWNLGNEYQSFTNYLTYKIESVFGEMIIEEGDTISSVECTDYIKLYNIKLDAEEFKEFDEAERFGL